MRTIIALLLVGLSALAIATTHTDKYGKEYKVAEKQKDLIRLFKYIFQQNYYSDQVAIAKSYQIEEHLDWYTNQKAVKEFLSYWKEGFLPRGEVFSVFYDHHKDEAVALFNIFYYAKDWETFYKTACWAREYVNELMFVYAMHAAVFHRNDTQGMVLPPIYEINPYFFVNSEVINKAYEYKMKYGGDCKGDEKTYYVQANYSGWYMNANPIQKDMAYFYEDVGLNSYYYYFNLDYPFWLGGEKFGLKKDRRGELFFFVHQQLLARYYLERLSNDHGAIHVFDWEEPIKTGNVPSLRYPNGLEFPVRPAHAHLMCNPHNQPFTYYGEDNVFDINDIEDYERRIRDAIDYGFVFDPKGEKIELYTPEGFEYLCILMQGSADSNNTRFFGALQELAHRVLGNLPHLIHKYKVVPSAMEHFETCLRDFIFYQFYNRITNYFLKYKSYLPHYTYSELNYPGVKIEDASFNKLETFFDSFEMDITNAIYVNEYEFIHNSFHIRTQQWHLDHQPFTYNILATNERARRVSVRVFMGPKFNDQGLPILLKENWKNFVEFDKFILDLKAGKNVIERHYHESETVKDRIPFRALYKNVITTLNGEEQLDLDMTEAHNGFPDHLKLPKGKVGGQEYQFFFYISPYTAVGSGNRYMDNLPFGYPFDRPIEDEETFFVPNSRMIDVPIFHNTKR